MIFNPPPDHPQALPFGVPELATTAEMRDVWKSASYVKAKPVATEYMWRRIEMLCRDIDRLLTALSQAREREAWMTSQYVKLQAKAVADGIAREAAAREEEREACAMLVLSDQFDDIDSLADAIRARSQS